VCARDGDGQDQDQATETETVTEAETGAETDTGAETVTDTGTGTGTDTGTGTGTDTDRGTAPDAATETGRPAGPPFSLEVGSREHYQDPALYDFEYRRRRVDVNFYRALASEVGAEPILELGCGTGRLLIPLVRDGRRVVGVDRSVPMLEVARARLARTGRRARQAQLVRADFCALGLRARFQLVLCPFNTLQHVYAQADMAALLASVRSMLAPGGRFAFDLMNPDLSWLGRDPRKRWARTRFHHPETGEELIYSTNHVYDRVSQINYIHIFYESADTGRVREVRLAHRMYFPAELVALLELGGFRVVERLGDFGWGPLCSDSEQQIIIAAPRSAAP